jgi:hypothetical protein
MKFYCNMLFLFDNIVPGNILLENIFDLSLKDFFSENLLSDNRKLSNNIWILPYQMITDNLIYCIITWWWHSRIFEGAVCILFPRYQREKG